MTDTDKTEASTPDTTSAPDTTSPSSPPLLQPDPTADLAHPTASAFPQSATQRRGNGFAGGILGGLIAAGAGFGLAQFVPDGWPVANISALSVQVAEQARQLDALRSQPPVPDSGLQDRLAALESAIPPDFAPIETRLATLESRLVTIETMPSGADATPAAVAVQAAALGALQAEVQALKTAATPAAVQAITAKAEEQLQQAEAVAAQIRADAEALTKTAETRAALGRLQAALDSGAPYAAVLAALPDLPAVLKESAETGLPTLATLQDSFPAAARAALEAALRADMGEGWAERVTSFLRTQTGARSLQPREGTDPDAILSRAEAALATGDLPTTLMEISTLSPMAQAALAEWRATAQRRLVAQQTVADLAATIGE